MESEGFNQDSNLNTHMRDSQSFFQHHGLLLSGGKVCLITIQRRGPLHRFLMNTVGSKACGFLSGTLGCYCLGLQRQHKMLSFEGYVASGLQLLNEMKRNHYCTVFPEAQEVVSQGWPNCSLIFSLHGIFLFLSINSLHALIGTHKHNIHYIEHEKKLENEV